MTTIYEKPHFAAGKIVPIQRGALTGQDFWIEDWLIRIDPNRLDDLALGITTGPAAKNYVYGLVDGKAPTAIYQDDLNFDRRFMRDR